MTITFENESDVIVYALEKIISFARENQYLFVANCAWWIAGILGLDSGVRIFIDNLESRRRVGQQRDISTTPRDTARQVSVERQTFPASRDPSEDQSIIQVLDRAEKFIEESERSRKDLIASRQRQADSLLQTKRQRRKANRKARKNRKL